MMRTFEQYQRRAIFFGVFMPCVIAVLHTLFTFWLISR